MSHKTKVLNHLKRRPITPAQAWNQWGCTRLAAYIYDLRSEGHKITTEIVRKGDKTFARYRLVA